EHLAQSRFEAVDQRQMGPRELRRSGARASWVVWVRLERSDADLHPVAQGQRVEQSVELCFAGGAVKAEGLLSGAPSGIWTSNSPRNSMAPTYAGRSRPACSRPLHAAY